MIANPLEQTEPGRTREARHGPWAWAGISLVYLILTLLLTYPLVFRLDSHLCGDVGDNYGFLWQFRWFSVALTDLHTSPFYTPFLNHPEGASLLLNPTTLFNTGLSIPLQEVFSVLTTYNLLVLASFWLSAMAMYGLVFSLTGSRLASFVGGVVYSFSAFHFSHALGHLSTLSIQWIPLFILYILKCFQTHRLRHGVLASLFLVLTALCSWHFLLSCGLLLGWTVLLFSLPWRRPKSLRVIRDGCGILCFTIVILSPLLVPMMLEAWRGASISGHPPRHYPADLAAFLVPNFTSSFGMLFSPVWSRFRANPIESSTYVGYAVMGLILVSLRRVPGERLAYWLVTLGLFWILSLGPFLNLLGTELPIPLPYAVLHALVPFASMAGVPARFHVISLAALAVLSGYGVQGLLNGSRQGRPGRGRGALRGLLAACLFLLLALEHLHVPLFLTKHSLSPFYAYLGQDPQAYALVDFTARGKALFAQSVHRKGLVGGYVARGEEGRDALLKESGIVRRIHSELAASPEDEPGSAGLRARAILEEHNIRHLIFPVPADPARLRDLLLLHFPGFAPHVENIVGGLGSGMKLEEGLAEGLLHCAEAVREREGLIRMLAFALKIRFFYASHPELLPSDTIGPFVPESERVVSELWSLPVTYEDDSIRVYSVNPWSGRLYP